MKKLIFIILFICSFSVGIKAQGYIQVNFSQPPALAIKAGNDTLVCKGHPVELGGSPTAAGGSSSYVFLWSPSDGLDDPTSPNPVATVDQTITYKLTVTDLMGCQAVHFITLRVDPCLGIDTRALSDNLSVFPNPSGGNFRIEGFDAALSGKLRVEIVNQIGRVVFGEDFEAGSFLAGLSISSGISEPGMYFINIRTDNGVITRRLMIQ